MTDWRLKGQGTRDKGQNFAKSIRYANVYLEMKTTQFHKDSRSMKFYETSSVTCCKHNIHRPKVRKGKGTKETKTLFISWVKQIKMRTTVIIFRLTIPIPALTQEPFA